MKKNSFHFYAQCNKYIHDALRLLLVTVSIYYTLVCLQHLVSSLSAFPAVCFVTPQLNTIASGREGGSYLWSEGDISVSEQHSVSVQHWT